MRTHWIFAGLMAATFLGLFVLAESLSIEFLTDPGPWLAARTPTVAAIGFFLLVSDVLLPVPASLVMIAHGALFGVLLGALLSLIGALGAASFGFALGRRGTRILARIASESERERANDFLDRWGELAVIASRPVPILAETIAVMAGTSGLSWSRFLLASVAGSVPAAVLYALAGSTAAALDNGLLVFGLVLLIAIGFWLVGRRLRSRNAKHRLREIARHEHHVGD